MLRRPKFWVITVLVLAVLLVVADRGGKFFVEKVVADRVQEALSTPDTPSVSLSGFPFLPQLLGQKFDKVEVDVKDADAGRVKVEHVHAVLTGVKRAGDGATVESISGEGLIDYAAATTAADPFTVAYGGPGLVKITGKVNYAGFTRTASATGKPRIANNQLIFKAEKVSTDLPGEAPVSGLVPDVKIPLREIPKGLTIKLNPTEAGIEFTFDGANLELSSKDITAAWGVRSVSPDETAYARRRTAT
jgi:hypothetical protein